MLGRSHNYVATAGRSPAQNSALARHTAGRQIGRRAFRRLTSVVLVMCSVCGCLNEIPKPEEQTADKQQPNKTGIIGQRTDDIGELQQGDQVLESQLPTGANPLTGGLNVYGPALEKLSKTQIHQALELHRAQYGEYPRSHDEFMTQIIQANKIKLPVLPGDRVYKYDVANHKLVVVAGPNQGQ